MTTNKPWKVLERAVATEFGTNRIPMSGALRSLKTNSDTLHPKLYIECKYRKTCFIFSRYKTLHVQAHAMLPHSVFILRIRETAIRGEKWAVWSKLLPKLFAGYSMYMGSYISAKIEAYKLFQDTAAKAALEGKTPLLAYKGKGETGHLYIFDPKDLPLIKTEYVRN